jgi:hypothetical protein
MIYFVEAGFWLERHDCQNFAQVFTRSLRQISSGEDNLSTKKVVFKRKFTNSGQAVGER